MQLSISGTKREIANAIADLNFKIGKLDLQTPEILADPVNGNGTRHHTMSAAARRRISLAQKARWAKTNGKK